MSERNERGPLLPDSDNVYRAILSPTWWPDDSDRPSSAAFSDDIFSVDVKSRTTPQETASRFRNVTRLAEFNCGEAKAIGFEARDEPDPNQPDNLAHAHVYFLDFHATNKNQRKIKARKLAGICQEVRT